MINMKQLYKVNEEIYYNPYSKQIIYNKNNYDINYLPYAEEQPEENVVFYDGGHSFCTNAGILLTNRCSLNCGYCSHNTGIDTASLNTKQIDNYIKLIIKNAIMKKMILNYEHMTCGLTITGGGEPTSQIDLLEHCMATFKRLCSEHNLGAYISVTTNGVCGKKAIDLLIKYADFITVSYDGISMVQDKNRPLKTGKPSNGIVTNTIKYLDHGNCSYGIRTTVGEHDYKFMNDMFDNIYFNFKNPVRWQIESISKEGRGVSCDSSNIKFADYYLKLLEYSKSVQHNFQIKNNVFSDNINSDICASAKGIGLWLDAHGNLFDCPSQIDLTDPTGYVSDTEVKFFKRENVPFSDYNKLKLQMCSDCYAHAHCGGGCPTLMPRNDKGLFTLEASKDVCEATKYFWRSLIENLHNKKEYAGYTLQLNQLSNNTDLIIYDIKKTWGK